MSPNAAIRANAHRRSGPVRPADSIASPSRAAIVRSVPIDAAEGCGRPAREVDHRIDFRLTQHTRLDESDPACGHHHDLKTYKGWAFVNGTGVRAFVSPDDPRHPGRPEQLYAQKYGPPGNAAPPEHPPRFGQLFALVE